MTLEQAYALGFVTLPALFVILALAMSIAARVKGWWRHRHTQILYTIRCDRCGRSFVGYSKRGIRRSFSEHECEIREFVPTGELIPDRGTNQEENR